VDGNSPAWTRFQAKPKKANRRRIKKTQPYESAMKIPLAKLIGLLGALTLTASAPAATLLGWNNLGMHCMDSDYSVFSILPPYNTIEAQLIVNGLLVTNGNGYTVTYQAMADPDGSINTTSRGKGNFYQFTPQLYGAVAVDMGLVGWAMPGPNNTPQSLDFETINHPAAGVATSVNWFRAEGIPITPYDDLLHKNPYPMMRLVARNSANQTIATNDIVLPVSDEMDCRACHASGSAAAARPAAGWVNDANPERDFRLNILRLHDQLQNSASYSSILASNGFNPQGLYQGVVADNRPVLCAKCHLSEALQGSGYGNIPPLTRSVHALHAKVMDPKMGVTLDNAMNRSACYQCHPGSTTKCLRGAMGSAVASDGTMAMQCQSCHGNMSQVGSASRVGWFMEPNCQSCHTGTASHNNGQIRFTSAFDATGAARVAVDPTFSTTPNTPAAGLSLYRFSVGHGGLQCEACHGSTHAEFPTSHRNDNVRDIELQGHAGVMAECTACHATVPNTVNGGPHGMHPVGQSWVSQHHDLVESVGAAQCQACHGTDYRGTVLSRAQSDRTLSAFGTLTLFRGAIIGCYTCHNGPGDDDANNSPAPTVSNVSASTAIGQSVAIALPATGTGLTLRIISQPANGTVGLNNNVATYFPDPGFSGTDTFTFAAYNGAKNSQLATGTVVVGTSGGNPGAVAPVITQQPASQTVTAGSGVTFTVTATGTAPLSYQWAKNGNYIAGATGATYTLSSVTAANAGAYSVAVGNSVGSVTSATATLTVANPPPLPPTTQPPDVQIAQPGSGSSYSAPARILLVAQAEAHDASISKVEFFTGTTRLGVAALEGQGTGALYYLIWSQVPSGQYSVTAKATDSTGASSTSAPVRITVRRRTSGSD
jgi:ferredoxin